MAIEPKSALLEQIRGKRAVLQQYLNKTAPYKRRLLNICVFGGSLSAVLTAAPALGGQSFTAWLTKTFALQSPAWQLLCGAAAIASIAVAIATQLLKSHNVEERVIKAQAGNAKLEVLDIGLTSGQVTLEQASAEFIKCVEDTAFVAGEGT